MTILTRVGKIFKVVKKKPSILHQEYYALLVRYKIEGKSKVTQLVFTKEELDAAAARALRMEDKLEQNFISKMID